MLNPSQSNLRDNIQFIDESEEQVSIEYDYSNHSVDKAA